MSLLDDEWKWHWHQDPQDEVADCGIYIETHRGHAYAIARCPRLYSKEQWEEVAKHICDLHNAALKAQG